MRGIVDGMSGRNRDLNLFEVPDQVPDGFIDHQNFISAAIQKLHLTASKYYQFTGSDESLVSAGSTSKELRYSIMMRTLRASPKSR